MLLLVPSAVPTSRRKRIERRATLNTVSCCTNVKDRTRILCVRDFPDAEGGFFFAVGGCIYAGDGMKRKGKYAGDGFKRGSSLVTLVTRRYDAVNAIYGQGFFFSFPFLPSSIRFIFHSATAPYGIVQGLLAPSTLGRGGTPLHPEERKAFLIRLRRCIHYRHHPLYCISSSPLYNRLSLCYNIHAPTE